MEKMEATEGSAGGNVSRHREIDRTKPALAFEAMTSANKLVSSGSKGMNASIQDKSRQSGEDNSIKPHLLARIFEVFESDEDLRKESSNKRRSDSSAALSQKRKRNVAIQTNLDAAPSPKRKTNVAIQTSSDEELQRECELIFRLCRCQDHVCPGSVSVMFLDA
ncbi:uncharacterized protein LOC133525614 [Cydia pomonella]|uniref:uncharacterized protein LOC133525614 n=1 Tax=Cydia pomonella TaxID=82600 RepID=UPI002ADD5059|nr:uncharacterized protein LOC133525614 [Cydia pomonella]